MSRNFRLDITARNLLARIPPSHLNACRPAIDALVGGGCTSAETLTCLTNAAVELARGVAGAVATVAMTLEQPLDKRLFDSKYDDLQILGKIVTRGDDWQPIGFALHVQNGAILGATYARFNPSLPGPAVLRGLLVGLIEHVTTWPMVALVDRYHPAREELPKLAANRRAFARRRSATQCSASSSGSSRTR
jgi:hypothetical protein